MQNSDSMFLQSLYKYCYNANKEAFAVNIVLRLEVDRLIQIHILIITIDGSFNNERV